MILYWTAAIAQPTPEVAAQRTEMLSRAAAVHGWTEAQQTTIAEIFARSDQMGIGNPASSLHPMTPEQCQQTLASENITWRDDAAERICGGPYRRPLYDPATQQPEDATTCIDTFEFPNLPCVYPVVWVRAGEAAAICEAQGKRLCDAHEWEGACAGALLAPDYRFDLAQGKSPRTAVATMRAAHNTAERLAHSAAPSPGTCATGSTKSPGCDGSSWSLCGSNTYPTGAFPSCTSALGVADLYGNTAEHMNLPLAPEQSASSPSTSLGVTEMKGAWFVWDTVRAHEDACRWRAPFWHGTAVYAPDSHRNYHLGFRCCGEAASPD